MQSRKSSLVIGSRTRRNVLKGKNVRKLADGADNFADYWTDSDSTGDSVTHEQLDLSQTQAALNSSNARLETLRQNVRKSQNSKHHETNVVDKLQKSKHTRLPLKSIKNNVLSSVKDVNRSLTNEQKISLEQDIHRSQTKILSNNSALSDGSCSHGDDEPTVSYRFKPSASNANALKEQTNNIAYSALPKTNVKEALVTQSKIQSSKNINSEENIESRAFDNSASAASDHAKRAPKQDLNLKKCNESDNCIEPLSESQHSTSDADSINKCTKNTSSPLSKKNKLVKTFIMQKSVPDVNLNTTYTDVLSKTKVMHDATDSFHRTESNVQPLLGKTVNEDDIVPPISRVSNIFMTSFRNRTVKKMRNSIQVSKTFENFDEYDAEILQMALENEKNETLNLPGKEHSFPKELKLDLAEKKKIKSSSSKRTVKSTEEALEDKISSDNAVGNFNEFQRSYNFRSIDKLHTKSKQKTSEIMDGIDEELLKKTTVSDKGNYDLSNSSFSNESETEKERSPNSKRKFANISKNDRSGQEIIYVSSPGKKSSAVKPTLKTKSTPVFNAFSKNYISNTVDQNRPHTRLNTSKTFPRSASERGTQIDDGSYTDNIGESMVLDTNENGDEAVLNFDNQIETAVSKTNKNVNASKNVSQDNIESATETGKENQTLHRKRKKPVNETNENLKASETFVKDNIKSGNEGMVSDGEINFEAVVSFNDERKKHINKANKKVKASKNVFWDGVTSATKFLEKENETSPRLLNKRKKSVYKTNENLKSSETVMKDYIGSGNEGRVSDIGEICGEAALSFDNKRKEHVNKKVKASENVSLDNIKMTTEFLEKENETTPSLLNKRKKPVNKTVKNLRNSATLYELREKSKNAEIPEMVDRKKSGKGVNERNESIFQRDDNDQVDIASRKKRRMKETSAKAACSTVSIRKSTRQRYPPFSKWQNERALYRVDNGIINFVGIDHGTGDDKTFSLKTHVKAEKRKAKVKKFTLDDVVTEKKIRLSLLKKFVDTPWDKRREGDKCPYRIKRPVQTINSAFGFIEMEKDAEKPKQYMPDDDLYLTLIEGKLECTVQNDTRVLGKKDMFVVPRCIPYSLKNIGTTKALLIFCVGKFNCVESLE